MARQFFLVLANLMVVIAIKGSVSANHHDVAAAPKATKAATPADAPATTKDDVATSSPVADTATEGPAATLGPRAFGPAPGNSSVAALEVSAALAGVVVVASSFFF